MVTHRIQMPCVKKHEPAHNRIDCMQEPRCYSPWLSEHQSPDMKEYILTSEVPESVSALAHSAEAPDIAYLMPYQNLILIESMNIIKCFSFASLSFGWFVMQKRYLEYHSKNTCRI